MSAGPQAGDPAPDATLLDSEGHGVQLSSFWRERPVVLVFLRYFGCPFCQMHVVKLREDQELFQLAGAVVVLIGQGSPEEGAGFCRRKHLPFPCLLDGDKSAYRAYGLRRRNLAVVVSPHIVGPFVRANLNPETRQRGLEGGDFFQMPGTFVVDREGVVRLAHRNRTIADSPPNQLLLEILARLAEPASPTAEGQGGQRSVI
jgi:peroxiredoxin